MKVFLAVILLLISSVSFAQKGQFMTVAEFKNQYFDEQTEWQTLWVGKALRAEIEGILGRRYTTLRVRYWGGDHRTAWVLEEIGKELPITVGVVVEDQKILDVHILDYRESRGGEIRYPFFTQQFKQLALLDKPPYQLNKSIDGITGATLSVRAMKKIATLALFFHQQTPFKPSLANAKLSP